MKILSYACFMFWTLANAAFFAIEEWFTEMVDTSFFNYLMYFVDRFWSVFFDTTTFLKMLNPFGDYYGEVSNIWSSDAIFDFWRYYLAHLFGGISVVLALLAPLLFALTALHRFRMNRG